MKNVLILLITVVFPFAGQSQNGNRHSLFFDYKAESLSAQEISSLDGYLKSLPKSPQTYSVVVKGYSDNLGTEVYNQALSVKRAKEVSQLLIEKGFKMEDIEVFGVGSKIPFADNETEIGRQQNRRVVVSLVDKSEAYLHHPTNAKVSGKRITGNANKEIRFTHPSGTEIVIPANSLVDQDGNPIQGEVNIEYTEYRDDAEIFVSGIPMTHGEDVFSSTGMFEIKATQKGKDLNVAPGKSIEMDFVMSSTDYDYNFYQLNEATGKWTERNDLSGGTLSGNNVKYRENVQLADPGVVKYRCRDVVEQPLTLIEKSIEALDSSITTYPIFEKQDFNYFNDRYANFDYVGTTKKELVDNKTPIRLVAKGKTKSGDVMIKIVDESNEHSEFTVFDKVKILVDPYLNDMESITSKSWVDVNVRYDQKKNEMELYLKADNNFLAVPIKADFNLKEDIDKAITETEKLYYGSQDQLDKAEIEGRTKNAEFYNSYVIARNERSEAFNKVIRDKHSAYETNRIWLELNICDRRDCYWSFMRPYLSPEEMVNGKFKWYRYAFDHRLELKNTMDSLLVCFTEDEQKAKDHRFLLDRQAYLKEQQAKYGWTNYKEEERDMGGMNEIDVKASIDKVYPKKEVASVSISLPTFGVFNGDYPINVRLLAKDKEKLKREPVDVIVAEYQDQNGNKIYPQVAYLFADDITGNVRMDGHNGLTPYQFPINVLTNNRLLVIDQDNNRYTVDALDKSMTGSPKVIKVKGTSNKMNTIAEVKEVILPQLP